MAAEFLRGRDGIDKGIWRDISKNKDVRYQFLQKVDISDDVLGQGLPELCIDFKKFFTIPTDEVYRRLEIREATRRSVLVSPYLEHLSSRFANYLCRVALPLDHASE